MADLIHTDSVSSQRSVTVYRRDDTIVRLAAVGREQALPTAAELTAIGADPQLTLYP